MPVIMVTGREDIASIDQAFEAGATSFAVKPINWRLLSHQIKYVLRMSLVERGIRQSRDRAEDLSKLKSSILAVMRHEFRTPLNSIIGFSDLMSSERNGPMPASYRQFAEHINQSGHGLLKTFTEIMNYAQLASSDIELSEDDYAIDAVIKLAIEDVLKTSVERAIDINCSLECDAQLSCDRAQIVRMVSQMLDNAIRHGAAPIALKCSLNAAGDLLIEVADKGAGISDASLAACLEPFSQADMSHARSRNGVGIGLPVAKRIAELHGGKFTMTSRLGQGTTVQIQLPRSRIRINDRAVVA
jgi:signal transduction histidine kinase